MANPKPRVFTIPASAPFLPTLIDALVNDRLGLGYKPSDDPLALANATLYLPTKRACQLARDVFLATTGTDAAILPRIVPIGDIDEDEIAFAEATSGDLAAPALELPEALQGLERRMVLAELILKWAQQLKPGEAEQAPLVTGNPAAALHLASDLARLMDDMTTRQVGWDKLDGLVPAEMDHYWEITLQFLKFMRQHWPAILDELGKIEPAQRRDALIEAERARLGRIKGPVIAAGSTGSMPTTAALIETIARLPHGAVVLPGLDTDLDEPSWRMIAGTADAVNAAQGHPQFAMHALLHRIGMARDAVEALAPPAPHGRERFISEALRPAATTELWQPRLGAQDFAGHADAALKDMAAIEAANAEEEALAIAIALREAAEMPGKTAALVTTDRALARRVLAALARWNVPVDDSGGVALADTPAGVFARLVAEAALEGLPPVKLLAMLKHPLCPVDLDAVAALEQAILRGPRPKSGSAGLEQALANFRAEHAKLKGDQPSMLHGSEPRASLTGAELDAAQLLAGRLKRVLAPLESLKAAPQPFRDIAAAHASALEALGADAAELDDVFEEISASGRIPIRPIDYAETLHVALTESKRWAQDTGARIRIYGSLESRLQTVDRVVLGGLTEGTWPPETRGDPWLSRPMRHTLGLDLPERRIGLSAHDFAQALGTHEVILTRAARVGGTPTVASRFVQRLAAVAGDERWSQALARGGRYLAWARELDRPLRQNRLRRPEPKPPREARPNRLSVTEIEALLRDPYAIYARRVLRLRPLEQVDVPPGARDRGSMIHEAVGDFTKRFADRLPDNVTDELIDIGRRSFEPLADFPDAKAFWWPRFQRIARWFAQFEAGRREQIAKLYAEIDGTLEITLPDGTVFTLHARADRIEALSDGTYAILDYKTGQIPSPKQVRSGLSPQLTLEGAILRGGKFADIPAGGSIAEIVYIGLRGLEPPGEPKTIEWRDTTPDEQADRALVRLTETITKLSDPDMPYRSREKPMFFRRNPGDYDHLARVKEWSLTGGEDDTEEGE